MMDNKKLMDAIDSLDNDKNYEIKQAAKAAREAKNEDAIKDKNSSDKANVVLVVIFIILIATAIFYYTSPITKEKEFLLNESGVSDNGNGTVTMFAPEGTEVVSASDLEKIKDNIVIEKEFFDVDGKLNFLVKNKNSIDVNNITVSTVFYNGSDKIIAIDEGNINVLSSGAEQYLTYTETPENAERYEILVEVDNSSQSYKSYLKDVSFECFVTEEEDEVIIRGKNNSESKLDLVEFEIVYYGEEDKILLVEHAMDFDIKRNRDFELNEYISIYDEEYKEIPYTRYEIRLINAYSYIY